MMELLDSACFPTNMEQYGPVSGRLEARKIRANKVKHPNASQLTLKQLTAGPINGECLALNSINV